MPQRRELYALIATGAAAGLLSGLFGVGGGIVVVPALMSLLAFDQRKASGTALASMVVTSVVGILGYLAHGQMDWLYGLLITAGAVIGVWGGAYLLHRLPLGLLRWLFILFQLFLVVELFFGDPVDTSDVEVTPLIALLLFGLGLTTGVLSGLFGIGGGVFVIPMLVIFFGVDNVLAKGISLLVILPMSISGSFANARRGQVDFSVALVISIVAIPFVLVGVQVSVWLDPLAGNVIFGCFILAVIANMLVRQFRSTR